MSTIVEVLSSIIETAGHDTPPSERRNRLTPLFERLKKDLQEQPGASRDHPSELPSPALVTDLILMIETLIFNESKIDSSKYEMILTLIQRVVQEITGADCVLVRRLLTDRSAELVGKAYFAPGRERGKPPHLKIFPTAPVFFYREDRRPTAVHDVWAEDAPAAIRETLTSNLGLYDEASDEHIFISAIRGEICIPLVVNGVVPAGIIAASWEGCTKEQAAATENSLAYWQRILSYLYAHAQALVEKSQRVSMLSSVNKAMRRLERSIHSADLCRDILIVLTAHAGLGWHRAMLFLFDDLVAPSRESLADAQCVAAIGGMGGANWSKNQEQIRKTFGEIDEFLDSAGNLDYTSSDPLYDAIASDVRGDIKLPGSELSADPCVRSTLSGRPDELGRPVPYQARCEWLSGGDASAELRSIFIPCDQRYLVPLVKASQWGEILRIGFFILDNPYPRPVEPAPDLELTQLVAHELALLLACRALEGRTLLQDFKGIRKGRLAAIESERDFAHNPEMRGRYAGFSESYRIAQ